MLGCTEMFESTPFYTLAVFFAGAGRAARHIPASPGSLGHKARSVDTGGSPQASSEPDASVCAKTCLKCAVPVRVATHTRTCVSPASCEAVL